MGRPVRTCSSPSSLDDPRARGRPVAEHAAADGRLERLDDLRRKAVRVGRERLLEDDAHHLPVAGGRVLAGAALEQATVGRLGGAAPPGAGRRPRRGRAPPGWAARTPRFEDVPQRVRPLVAVGGRVRQLAGAAAVQHAHEDRVMAFLLLTAASPRARVRLEEDLAQVLDGHVSVDLRRAHVGVAEHLLHAAQVGPGGQQMRGERVAERVGAGRPSMPPAPARRAGCSRSPAA